jgi:outer membrane protein
MRITVVFILSFVFLQSNAQTLWTLDSCVVYALSNNISVKQAELNVELGDISKLQATGNLLPSLNGQGSHGYNWGQRIDPFTNQFATARIQSNSFGLATSINLFSGFQNWNALKKADIDKEVSVWNYEKMKNDIALNVATAFLNLVVNREVMQIAKNNLEQTDKQVNRIVKLVNAGQLSEANLSDIQAQRAADEANYISSQNNVYLAKLSLAQLLMLSGEQAENFDVIIPAIDDIESIELINNVDVIVQAALSNFPEIKSAEASMLSADLNYKIAKGGIYPRLTASYSYGTGYSGASKVVTGSPDSLSFPIGQVFGSNQFVFSFPQAYYTSEDYSTKPFSDQLRDNVNKSLFFNLNIPIFNGFSTYSSIKRAQIGSLSAAYSLDQTKLQLIQSVERAYADAKASLANYIAAKSSLEASQKAFGWAEKRYEQGVANSVEYGDARARVDNAQATLLRNKYEYLFKLKVLDFYLGKPISLKS